jgi:hypothetical protein
MNTFYTVACFIKAQGNQPLYVGRYDGSHMNALEVQAERFPMREQASAVAKGLAETRHDMVFVVCDVIANGLETYTFTA